MRHRSVLLAVALVFLGTSPAAAHRPEEASADGVTEVPDLSTSYAYYQETDGNEIDVFVVDGHAGDDLFVGITIPQIQGLEDYGVSLAVVASGLEADGLSAIPEVGVEWPEGAGAIVAEDRFDPTFTDDGDFFESFTQTRYWERQRIKRTLLASGPVYYVVWQPDGRPGKYVLDSGQDEVFDGADLVRGVGWWFEVNVYFGHWLRVAAASLVLGGVLVLIVTFLVRWLRTKSEKSLGADQISVVTRS